MSLAERFRAGDVAALARLITLVENGEPAAADLVARLSEHVRPVPVIGITGPPGAGKSTLVAALVRHWRAQGQRVAVLAIDPSSARSGGAALGDRLRLALHGGDPGVFIRSMASRGRLGGVADAAAPVVRLLRAFGFDQVIVETVGVGQSEIDIARLADIVVVLQVPGLGDEVQAIKAGLLEVADLVVVNKADLPGAGRLAAQLRAMLAAERAPRIVQVSASTGAGIEQLADVIAEITPGDAGNMTRTATATPTLAQARAQILDAALTLLRQRLERAPLLPELAEHVRAGRVDVAEAASRLVAASGLGSPKDM